MRDEKQKEMMVLFMKPHRNLALGSNYDPDRDQHLLGHLGETAAEVQANVDVLIQRGALQVIPCDCD